MPAPGRLGVAAPSAGIEAGALAGSVVGPGAGSLALTLGATGAVSGHHAAAASPGAWLPVTGSVATGGVITFAIPFAAGSASCVGYLAGHRISGGCGSAGVFVATLTPAAPVRHPVGGTVSGLAPGATLGLLDYGSPALAVSQNGSFWLPAPLPQRGGYHLTVGSQPAGQTCAVSNGTGVVPAVAVTSIRIDCTPVPDPAPATAGATCKLPDFQASLLARVNQYRSVGASCRSAGSFAPALLVAWNGRLEQAAAAHSLDMAALDYFSHSSADGRSMADRINATGYPWRTIGENIAAGYPTAHAVVDAWMGSDGHCANVMQPAFQEMGVACVASATSTYPTYWTMNLGAPR